MAQDLNTVALIGRLTREAELKYTPSGVAIGTFSVAVNRSVKKNGNWTDEASFFECTVFGKSAENLKQYLVKGQQVAIQGELKQDRWESDGQTRSKITVVADNIQLIGGKKTSMQGTYESQSQQYAMASGHDSQDDSFPEQLPF